MEDQANELVDEAEQASLLSDCEEDYMGEFVVGSLPLVILEGGQGGPVEMSPCLEERIAQAQASAEEETSFGEEPLSLEQPERGDSASPTVSSALTEENNIQPWQTFSETNILSESDEEVLFGPMPEAEVHFEQTSNKPMEKLFGEGSTNSVIAGSLLPTSPNTLTVETVEENNQPLQSYSETNFLSESDEDDPRADAKVLVIQPSGIPLDTLGTSDGKAFISESRELMPQNLPSPKLDHVGDVMLGLGSKFDQDSGAGGLEVDSTSPVKLDVKETTRRKGAIMRLGSKEAEELLQLDLTKMGRAILPSVTKGSTGTKSPKTNGVGWGVDDLGPDEVIRSCICVQG